MCIEGPCIKTAWPLPRNEMAMRQLTRYSIRSWWLYSEICRDVAAEGSVTILISSNSKPVKTIEWISRISMVQWCHFSWRKGKMNRGLDPHRPPTRINSSCRGPSTGHWWMAVLLQGVNMLQRIADSKVRRGVAISSELEIQYQAALMHRTSKAMNCYANKRKVSRPNDFHSQLDRPRRTISSSLTTIQLVIHLRQAVSQTGILQVHLLTINRVTYPIRQIYLRSTAHHDLAIIIGTVEVHLVQWTTAASTRVESAITTVVHR